MKLHFVYWQNPCTLWHLAGRWLAQAGYADTATLANAIRTANPGVLNWKAIDDGLLIAIPFL